MEQGGVPSRAWRWVRLVFRGLSPRAHILERRELLSAPRASVNVQGDVPQGQAGRGLWDEGPLHGARSHSNPLQPSREP